MQYKPPETSISDDKTVYEKIEAVKNDPNFFETQKYLKVIPEKHRRLELKTAFLVFFCSLIVGAGLGCLGYFLFSPKPETVSTFSITKKWGNDPSLPISPLTGKTLSDASLVKSPSFCVQIPNGLDGARPQVGLNEAGVVFEAIAEAGITRFSAIFQNPSSTIIGPIRSLRLYYLEWDTPFDCTVVHAGGAEDAVSLASSGAYRDLTENENYMWRGDSNSFLDRQWNNLFTSNFYLNKFNEANGFSSSDIKGFPRETEKSSKKLVAETLSETPLNIDEKADSSVKTLTPKVKTITLKFGDNPYFNPTYEYNTETNSYDRSYAGEPHTSYNCTENADDNTTPELSCGEPTQISPNVVIAMLVNESLSADGVHESITTLGTNKAYIFQNGNVIEGTWEKSNRGDQITFLNDRHEEIKFTPGSVWISAIPIYGTVEYN